MKLATTLIVLGAMACGGAPKTASERTSLEQNAQATLTQMTAKDPSLQGLLDMSAGYAVFPDVGKGGLIVGGAHGKGVLYENGQRTGFVELSQASIGAQIGAQSFAEILVLRLPYDVQRIKNNQFSLDANASAVALSAGAAASASSKRGVNVFVMPRGGMMAEASVGGQQITFKGG